MYTYLVSTYKYIRYNLKYKKMIFLVEFFFIIGTLQVEKQNRIPTLHIYIYMRYSIKRKCCQLDFARQYTYTYITRFELNHNNNYLWCY